MSSMPSYQYRSGYQENIGRPLGIPPGDVDDWVEGTGFQLRRAYNGHAPKKTTKNLPPEWIDMLKRLYLDRREEASRVQDSWTDWARVAWPDFTGRPPTLIRTNLSAVLGQIRKRMDRTNGGGAGPPSSPQKPQSSNPPRRSKSPLAAIAGVSSPQSSTDASRIHLAPRSYSGPGVRQRTAMLELLETPSDWPLKTHSPEDLGINVIPLNLFVNGPDDVPDLRSIVALLHKNFNPYMQRQGGSERDRWGELVANRAAEFKVTHMFQWRQRQSRDGRTGEPRMTTFRCPIRTEEDLVATWLTISRIPVEDEDPTIFFELGPRSVTGFLGLDDEEPPEEQGGLRPSQKVRSRLSSSMVADVLLSALDLVAPAKKERRKVDQDYVSRPSRREILNPSWTLIGQVSGVCILTPIHRVGAASVGSRLHQRPDVDPASDRLTMADRRR